MRRVLHLSDLHFGRDRPELAEPLLAAIAAASPDLVAVSGDLTQRARRAQYAAAAAFLRRIESPVLTVPGNHDVPLWNLPRRWLSPFRAWKRGVGTALEPVWKDGELCVVGVNTVDPFSWQRGRISENASDRICAIFDGAGRRFRIVVAHHPFEQAETVDKAPTRGAEAAVQRLAECGTDIVLSGHLHLWGAAPFATRIAGRAMLHVQAGTGLSNRLRGEENDFNLLTLDGESVTVERFVFREGDFRSGGKRHFRLGKSGWAAEDRRAAA